MKYLPILCSILVLSSAPAGAQLPCEWEGDNIGTWTGAENWGCFGFDYPDFRPIPPLGVSFSAEIGGGATVSIINPLDPIAISNLTLTDSSKVLVTDGASLLIQDRDGDDGQVLSDGEIALENLLGALSTTLSVDGPVTFSGGGTVRLGGMGTRIVGNQAFNPDSTVIIENHTIEGVGALGADSTSIHVHPLGVVDANVALAELEIDPGDSNNVVNQGIIRASNGGLLRIKETGINNTDGTISAGNGSVVELQEVAIFGGEMTGSGVIRGIGTVTLEEPIANRGNYVVGNGAITFLDGNLINEGLVTLTAGNFSMKTPAILSGGGEVILGVPGDAPSFLSAAAGSGASLENEDNTIHGGGNILLPLTNKHILRADEPTVPLRILVASSNQAVMEASSGATLNLRGAVTNSGGEITATDGTVLVDNAGSIIGGNVVIENGASMELANSEVQATVSNRPGGTITALQFITNRLTGDVTNSSGAEIVVNDLARLIFSASSTYSNPGTIRLTGDGEFASFATCSLSFDGIVTLTGGGEIVMSNSSRNVLLGQDSASGVVNLDNTIRGTGKIGLGGFSLTNRALIEADLPPTAEPGTGLLSFTPGLGDLVNTGIIRARNGGSLQFFEGIYQNDGGTIHIAPGSSLLMEAAADIHGGKVSTDGDGFVEVRRSSSFDGTTSAIEIDAATRVKPAGRMRLKGNVSNRKKIAVEAGGQLQIDGPVTLGGGGEINLTTPTSVLVNTNGGIPGDLLINVDNRITGSGRFLGVTVQNGGALAPGNSPGSLVVSDFTQTGSGVVEIEILNDTAGNFDVLQVQGVATLGGKLRVLALPGIDVSVGETFDIITTFGITGSFESVEVPLDDEGNPLFTLAQIGNTLRLTAVSDIQAPVVTFDDWAVLQGLDPSNNGQSDDPNQDGLPNIGAYFLGVPALGGIPGNGVALESVPGGDFILTFASPLHVDGVTIGTEISEDMSPGSWREGPVPQVLRTVGELRHYGVSIPGDPLRSFTRLTFSPE